MGGGVERARRGVRWGENGGCLLGDGCGKRKKGSGDENIGLIKREGLERVRGEGGGVSGMEVVLFCVF